MTSWIDSLIATITAELDSQSLDPADVAYATKRRMAYDIRWPTRRQMEAHLDAATGNPATLEAMKEEFAQIKAHSYFAKP
ncbi:hypothetical protein [Magnetospirillum fulvum]|uniref:Uncharacterized protein n=1 Tax=Magnetospirillum fulvum TaxID=1082 RepID=A0A1H6IC45_MAGFU|nr:hypothetical protein [Magnetospirillum fulvum]SEH45370.1 hypothetical protein SAMN04244559_02408 [Magnetospirillum fulvum]